MADTGLGPLPWWEKAQGYDWRTKRALLFYTLFLLSLSVILLTVLQKFFTLNEWLKVGILVIPVLILAIIWSIWDIFVIFKGGDRYKIRFAIQTEDNSSSYFKEIKKEIKRQLSQFNLNELLSVGYLRPSREFLNEKEAEQFINRNNINLLVWGDTLEGGWQGESLTSFKLRFSYLFTEHNKEVKRNIGNLIDPTIHNPKWNISKSHSFYEIAVVSTNIVEVSLFILGTSLATNPHGTQLLMAEKILSCLQGKLVLRNEKDFPNLQPFRKRVNNVLMQVCVALSNFYWWGSKKDLVNAKIFAEKALAIEPNLFNMHQNMALYEFLSGNRIKAEMHTRRAKQLNSQSDLPDLNEAFFAALDSKGVRLLQILKNRIRYVGDTKMTVVVEFLYEQWQQNPLCYSLLFYLGWCNFVFVDHELGKDQLQEFIQKADAAPECKELVAHSQKLLNK